MAKGVQHAPFAGAMRYLESKDTSVSHPWDPTEMSDKHLAARLCEHDGSLCVDCPVSCAYGREWVRRQEVE